MCTRCSVRLHAAGSEKQAPRPGRGRYPAPSTSHHQLLRVLTAHPLGWALGRNREARCLDVERWWRQQVLVSRAISLGADGDGRTAVTLPYPVESENRLRRNTDAGLILRNPALSGLGCSPGDPHQGIHMPVTKAENFTILVRLSDFDWVLLLWMGATLCCCVSSRSLVCRTAEKEVAIPLSVLSRENHGRGAWWTAVCKRC